MRIRFRPVLLLLVPGLVLVSALSSLAADFTFTIRGRVVYPDGRPAPGIELRLVPYTPEGLDFFNAIWKIPNYDPHYVTTDADGNYVMTNVIDYPENTTHRYTLYVTERTRFYQGTLNFRVRYEMSTQVLEVHLQEATWITVKLKDRTGKPFNGTRAVYWQTGTNLSDPSTGFTKITELTFVNGEAGVRIPIRDKGSPVARLAILGVPSRAEARRVLQTRGLKHNDTSTVGLTLAAKDAKGRALDRQFTLPPVGETTVEFAL